MTRKNKGFTLVEIVVALACFTLISVGVFACFDLVYRSAYIVLQNSRNIYNLGTLKDYIMELEEIEDDSFSINDEGDVVYNEDVIINDTSISSIDFEPIDGRFVKCKIIYLENKETCEFTFLVKGGN